MNGNEKLYYAENAAGHIYITDISSPVPPGFIKHMTTIPKVMDTVYAKLHNQEREANEKLIEQLYERQAALMIPLRAKLRARQQESSCSAFEKSLIREALARMDEREHKMQENHTYGVSAMQTTEANPKEPGANRVTFDAPAGMVN